METNKLHLNEIEELRIELNKANIIKESMEVKHNQIITELQLSKDSYEAQIATLKLELERESQMANELKVYYFYI